MYAHKAIFIAMLMAAVLLAFPGEVWAQGGRLSLGPAASASTGKVKSFREWKLEKIQDAEKRLESAKSKYQHSRHLDPNLKKSAALEGQETESERVETILQTERSAVELARDLSVSDYFAGYLAKVADKPTAFKEVAGKLSAEEVAELMAAYASSVFGSSSASEVPPSAQGSSPEIR